MNNAARHASTCRNTKFSSIHWAIYCAIVVATTQAAFPVSSVKGSDQFRYRSGLRNSPGEKKLDRKELDAVARNFREKSGFVELHFDEAGFLSIGDRTNINGGSLTARNLLIATVETKGVVEIESYPRSMSVTFARMSNQTVYENRTTGAKIDGCSIQIDFSDFSLLRGDKQALSAFDPGFVILHELGHAVLGLRDSYDNSPGECETTINRIRRELGLPERQTYIARVYSPPVPPGASLSRRAELVFRNMPGIADGKSEFRLDWDALRVGPVMDNSTLLSTKTRNTKTIATSSVAGQ